MKKISLTQITAVRFTARRMTILVHGTTRRDVLRSFWLLRMESGLGFQRIGNGLLRGLLAFLVGRVRGFVGSDVGENGDQRISFWIDRALDAKQTRVQSREFSYPWRFVEI